MEQVTLEKSKANHYVQMFEDGTIIDSFVSLLDLDSPFIGTFTQVDSDWLSYLCKYVYRRTSAQIFERLVTKILARANLRRHNAELIKAAKAKGILNDSQDSFGEN